MNYEILGKGIRESFLTQLENIGLRSKFRTPEEYLVGKERFFGEYYAIFLAEIIGLHDEDMIKNLGVTSLFGRAFVIAQDQVLDNPANPNLNYILASPVLYHEFVRRMNALVGNSSFDNDMEQILNEAREVNVREQQNHRGRIVPYNQEDLDKVGRKTGLVRIPAKGVCYLVNSIGHAERLASISDNVLVSIQICDDLSDVAEDYMAGNYTIPVTHGIILSPDQAETLDAIYQGLFFGGLFESLLSYNIALLRQTKTDIGFVAQKETNAEKYVSSLEKYVSNILEKFRVAKRTFGLGDVSEKNFTKLEPIQHYGEVEKLKRYLEQLKPENIAPKKLIV